MSSDNVCHWCGGEHEDGAAEEIVSMVIDTMQSPVQGKHLRDWNDVVIEKRRLATEKVADAVAQAVRAERERCAQIAAKGMPIRKLDPHGTEWSDGFYTGGGNAKGFAWRAQDVAKALLAEPLSCEPVHKDGAK